MSCVSSGDGIIRARPSPQRSQARIYEEVFKVVVGIRKVCISLILGPTLLLLQPVFFPLQIFNIVRHGACLRCCVGSVSIYYLDNSAVPLTCGYLSKTGIIMSIKSITNVNRTGNHT
jgi:hypothetical protein